MWILKNFKDLLENLYSLSLKINHLSKNMSIYCLHFYTFSLKNCKFNKRNNFTHIIFKMVSNVTSLNFFGQELKTYLVTSGS